MLVQHTCDRENLQGALRQQYSDSLSRANASLAKPAADGLNLFP
jgi:hypothetical protein